MQLVLTHLLAMVLQATEALLVWVENSNLDLLVKMLLPSLVVLPVLSLAVLLVLSPAALLALSLAVLLTALLVVVPTAAHLAGVPLAVMSPVAALLAAVHPAAGLVATNLVVLLGAPVWVTRTLKRRRLSMVSKSVEGRRAVQTHQQSGSWGGCQRAGQSEVA